MIFFTCNKIAVCSFFILSLSLISNDSSAQLTTNNAMTPTQLVQNVLLGAGITASNITFSGDSAARGSFNGTLSNIGFTSGIILAAGNITNSNGPNNTDAQTTDFGTSSTDPELTAIASNTIYDAAILEFDFIPVSDSIKFRYVFASEEYPEYVCSNFNDVFGFFVSGPNPAGGTYTNKNIAIVPTSNPPLAVAINTVNPGVAGANSGGGTCTSLAYSSLYFDNETPPGTTVQYDGFTNPLTAKEAVICGQTYHIKIAIADVGDGSFDSGVFLEAGSFSSQGIMIIPQISYGGANDSVLFEGCGQACINFIRTSNISQTDTVTVSIAGTAINGVDYNTGLVGASLPSQLIFQAGQDSVSYCINAVSDGSTEGFETILLAISQTGPCIQTSTNATIYLAEPTPMILSTSSIVLCNGGESVLLNAIVGGGVEPYSYSWSNGAAPIANPVVLVNSSTTFVVTVNDACTSSVDPTPAVQDSVVITLIAYTPLTVDAGDDIFVCPGIEVNLNALVNGGSSPYIYNWSTFTGTDSVTFHDTPSTSVIANQNGIYLISVMDICGNTQNDQVAIIVDPSCTLNIPNIITPDGQGPAINEFFYIDNLEKFPGSSIAIYDRWGGKIYSSSNYPNNWKGSGCSDGTYYYVLTIPAIGATQAMLNNNSYSDIKTTTSSDAKVIAGFFQLVRSK